MLSGILTNRLLDSSLSPHLVVTVVISGDSSLPGTGPHSAFFQIVQVR